MHEFLTIFFIAVALSMDTFSVSLSIGTFNINIKDGLRLSIIVGIMHFIMPLIGILIGSYILKYIPLDADFILGTIFLILSGKTTYDFFIEDTPNLKLSFLGMLIFSFCVSFDAFSTGIALYGYTNKILLSLVTFMFISFLFTLLGIICGKCANKILGKIATVIGIFILLILAICLII